MKKNNFFLIFTASLMMISMLALTPYDAARSNGVSTSLSKASGRIVLNQVKPLYLKDDVHIPSQPDVAPFNLINDVSSSSQAAALAAIDTAMASIVAKYGSLTAITDPGDLLAYRWLAMAKDYVHFSYTPTLTPTNTPFLTPTFTPSPTLTNTSTLTPSNTPAKGGSLIPPGIYKTSWERLTLNADGTYSQLVDILSIDGNWTGTGNQITFTEISGGHCTGIPGTYQWSLSGKVLTFTKVQDDCTDRANDLPTGMWTLH